jgi:hypothetical protein
MSSVFQKKSLKKIFQKKIKKFEKIVDKATGGGVYYNCLQEKRTPDQDGGEEKRRNQNMEKVEQFYNKNQFLIRGASGVTFQSYKSTIANINSNGKLTFFSDWDYSKTTLKHLYLFLHDYKNSIENFVYSQIFSKGFECSKNKKQFLQNLINKKIIEYMVD